MDHVVIHYSEIGTKSGNRAMFEKTLARNIGRCVRPWIEIQVRRETGRLVFPLDGVDDATATQIVTAVARLPGVAAASAAEITEPTLEALRETAVRVARRRTGSFKIRARRQEKTLPFRSHDVNCELGAAIQADSGRPVDVHQPDTEYRIEVDSKRGYVYDARTVGPGGLPAGASGKVVCLLSGGLDSPVAAYRMMVRGCRVIAVHLWNRSYSGDGVREKVLRLGQELAKFQQPFELSLVPFDDIQQEIIAASPAPLRMLLYRRAMIRVADRIRARTRALATVTGDAVGQVASQTLQNLAAVYDAAQPPILSPLCGMNKLEVVATAKRIGTYEASILPGNDCCGLMIARHPSTACSAERLREIEAEIPLDDLVRAAVKEQERHKLLPDTM